MGGEKARGDWVEIVRAFKELLSKKISIEALIVHGSASRSGLSPTSDIDVLVVSEDFRGLSFHERMRVLEQARVEKVEALGYTFSELEKMFRKANPLVLGALIEGIHVVSSERVQALREQAKKTYTRVGRVWKPADSS